MTRTPDATVLLLLTLGACAPAPDHVVLELGPREIRFHRAELESGGGVEPVWMKLRARQADGRTSIEMTLHGDPGINLSRFAGRRFESAVAAGRPGSASLEIRIPQGESAWTGQAANLVVEVRASAPGILQAEAKGTLAQDGASVPIHLRVERR